MSVKRSERRWLASRVPSPPTPPKPPMPSIYPSQAYLPQYGPGGQVIMPQAPPPQAQPQPQAQPPAQPQTSSKQQATPTTKSASESKSSAQPASNAAGAPQQQQLQPPKVAPPPPVPPPPPPKPLTEAERKEMRERRFKEHNTKQTCNCGYCILERLRQSGKLIEQAQPQTSYPPSYQTSYQSSYPQTVSVKLDSRKNNS
jgi:hypothetical protein